MKYVSLVLLGLLIAVLAGCGGGGDGGKGDKITELTADLELVQADLKKAQAELATTKGRLTTTQGDLSKTKETLTTTQGELSTTKGTLTTTQETLTTTKGELATTKETLSTTQGELATTKETLSTTQGELTTTKETLSTTKETLTTTQETLTTTEASLTDAQSDLKTAKASLTDAQSELAITRTTLETAEASLTTLMAKAGVDTVAALNTELDDYVTLQYKVDALLFQFDVDDLEDLRDKLKTDTGLQAEVNALLTATGQTTLAALETAYTTAKTMNTQAQAVLTATDTTTLTAAVAEIDRLKKAETRLQGEVNTEKQKATDAVTEANERVQSQEANQRAQKLKEAFPLNPSPAADLDGDGTDEQPIAQVDSPVDITVPTSSLTLTRGGYKTATLSGSGIRSATMALTSGADSGKTVVYTDRELTRTLLAHYGNQRDPDAPQFNAVTNATIGNLIIEGAQIVTLNSNITGASIVGRSVTPSTGVSFSHSLSPALSATAYTKNGRIVPSIEISTIRAQARAALTQGDDETKEVFEARVTAEFSTRLNTAMIAGPMDGVGTNVGDVNRVLTAEDDAFSGSVHGVSGQFRCRSTGCMITVTGTYNDNVDGSTDPDENDLANVQIASTGGLYFRPSSSGSTVSLCDDSARCTAGTDGEYMVFGYWREDPTSPAADYKVGLFAEAKNVTGSLVVPSEINAIYDGTAVGMYVEQDPANPVDTHRQGEFTADVDLRVSGAANSITGTIDDFVTTPTGDSAAPRTSGRWVVRLNASNAVEIDNLAGTTQGSWEHTYVRAHANAADANGTSDATPPAVTGSFNARIVDFVHLLGAFGAEKR